ncbi:MAG: fibrillarin-like rRNA/tRNA 2'-O-methyltransferase [Nanoarchaeota archaeon]
MKNAKHDNVFLDGRRIVTKNKTRGEDVYGERLFSEAGIEYRTWDPKRSKLGATIAKNMKLPALKKTDVWLYLGAASGTTVSHISDIVEKGIIFAVEFAPRVARELYFLSEKRENIAPIMADANKLEEYNNLVCQSDILFQDIAQREQVNIFLKNLVFLKKGGYAILSCKSRSIDVGRKPKSIFLEVEKRLREELEIVDWGTIEPFELDHAVFICRKTK